MTTGRQDYWTGKRKAQGAAHALLFALCALLYSFAFAQTQGDIEDRVREIAGQLRCPVCQNLSVADSPSELAVQMRDLIRERLETGESDEAIQAYFISKYGEWVLLSPEPKGFNLLVWTLPFFIAIAGVSWASVRLLRWVRPDGRPLSPEPVDQRALDWLYHVRKGKREGSRVQNEKEHLLKALEELEFDFHSGKLSEPDYQEMKRLYESRATALFSSAIEAREEAPSSRQPKAIPQRKRPREGRAQGRWFLPVGGIVLMVLGVVLGLVLAQSTQPRGEEDSITGSPLTGTRGVFAQRNPEEEPPALEGGVASQTADPTLLVRLGREAYQRQEYAKAIDAFKRVLALDPRQPEALTFMGLFMLQAGHFEQAQNYIDRALAVHRYYPPALEMKGTILHRVKGDHQGAIRVWEELLQNGGLTQEERGVISRRIGEAKVAMQKTKRGEP